MVPYSTFNLTNLPQMLDLGKNKNTLAYKERRNPFLLSSLTYILLARVEIDAKDKTL